MRAIAAAALLPTTAAALAEAFATRDGPVTVTRARTGAQSTARRVRAGALAVRAA